VTRRSARHSSGRFNSPRRRMGPAVENPAARLNHEAGEVNESETNFVPPKRSPRCTRSCTKKGVGLRDSWGIV
jgi:hypothetical protein